jgi:hypothetical protein
VIITTVLGRTVKTFIAKGGSRFILGSKTSGAGMYFVEVRTTNHVETYRLFVN